MLTYKKTYLNPYEQAKENLQNDELYKELGGNETWTRYAKSGSLNTLLGTINEAKSTMSIDDIHKLPNWNDYNSEQRLQQLAVSMFTDNEKVKEWDEISYDELGNPQNVKVSMTERQYYQKQLDKDAEQNRLQLKLKEEQEYKDQMNWWLKAANNVGAFVAEAGTETLEYFRGQVNFVASLFKGMWNISQASSVDEFTSSEFWDAAWRDAGTYEFLPSISWKESLYEWERTNTDLMTITGESTTALSIARLLGNTLGQVAFTYAFNATGAALSKVGGNAINAGQYAIGNFFINAAPSVQTAGQVLYWGGMAGNNYRELCNDPSLADVPTIYLATNSMLRAAGEYAISKGLANFWGATSRAKMMHNWSSKINTVGGIKRYLTDALKDGVEEALQEYSGQFINTASYILQSQFGGKKEGAFEKYSGYNFQNIMDAFAAGVLVTGISSSLQIVGTKSLYKNEYKLDKQGNVMFDENGKVLRKKYSKITSWDIVQNIDTLVTQVNETLKNKDLSVEERELILQQAYKSAELISSYFGQIGTERVNKVKEFFKDYDESVAVASMFNTEKSSARDMYNLEGYKPSTIKFKLDESGKYKSVVESKKDEFLETEYAYQRNKVLNDRLNIVAETILDLQKEFTKGTAYFSQSTYDKQKEDVKKKLEKAKITETKQTVNKTTDLTEGLTPGTEDYKSAKAIENIFKETDADNVVVSKDGVKPVKINNTVVVPEKMIATTPTNDIGKDVIKSLALEDAITRIIKAKELKFAMQELLTLYRSFSNNSAATIDEAVSNLFVDNGFFSMSLMSGSKFVRPFLLQLDKIFDIASGSAAQTDVYKQQIGNVKKQWQKSIINFLIIQDNADANLATVLTTSQLSYVNSHRYGKDMANRIIDGKPLPADKSVMEKRVNSLTIPSAKKKTLLDNLYSKDKDTRVSAINYLNRQYFGMYRSLFDDKIYPSCDTPQSYKLAKILLNNDVTLENWLTKSIPHEKQGTFEEVLKQRKEYYNEQFKQLNNNQFGLVINNDGSYKIKELHAQSFTGGEQYRSDLKDVISGKYADKAISKLVKAEKSLYEGYMDSNISDIGKQYYTLTDLIKDTSLLNFDTAEKILNKFGVVNEYTTFQYISNDILSRTGATSVVKTNNGEYIFVNVKPFNSLLIKEDVKLGENPDIKKLIKNKYLNGLLKTTKIVYDKATYYDTKTNTIHLDEVCKTNEAYARFALLHEIQHVIQYQNNIGGGLAANWLMQLQSSKRKQIVNDIKLHNPDIFQDVNLTPQQEIELAQDFVYFQISGEQQAYGLLGNAIVNRVPYFVRRDAKGVHLDTTWGTYDLLTETQSAYPVRQELPYGKTLYKSLVPVTEYKEYIKKYNPDANVKFNDTENEYKYTDLEISEYDTKQLKQLVFDDEYNSNVDNIRQAASDAVALYKFAEWYPEYLKVEKSDPFDKYGAIADKIRDELAYDMKTSISFSKGFLKLIKSRLITDKLKTNIINSLYNFLITDSEYVQSYTSIPLGITGNTRHPDSNVAMDKLDYYIGGNYAARVVSLHKMWLDYGKGMKYEDFLFTPIPFIRAQNSETYYDAPFVSAVVGDSIVDARGIQRRESLSVLRKGQINDKNTYVTYGTLTPNSVVSYINPNENEVLITVDTARNATTTQLRKLETKEEINELKAEYNQIPLLDEKSDALSEKDVSEELLSKAAREFANINNEKFSLRKIDAEDVDLDGSYIILPDSSLFEVDSFYDINSKDIIDFAIDFSEKNNLTNRELAYIYNSFAIISTTDDKYHITLYPNLNKNTIQKVLEISKTALNEGIPVTVTFDNYLSSRVQSWNNRNIVKSEIRVNNAFDLRVLENYLIKKEKNQDFVDYQYAKTPDNLKSEKQSPIFDNTEQPKVSRYVSNTEAKGTLLEYYIVKGKPIQVDPKIQTMLKSVKKSDVGKIEDGLLDLIKKRELNVSTLYEYVRKAASMNNYTWKLINDNFYHNENIRTFDELVKLSDVSAEQMYALSAAIRASKKLNNKFLDEKITPSRVQKVVDRILSDENLKFEAKIYNDVLTRFETYKSNKVDVQYDYLRHLMAKNWDGTLISGSHMAAIVKWIARVEAVEGKDYGPRKAKTVSTETTYGNTRHADEENMTLEDTLLDRESEKAFDITLDSASEAERRQEVLNYFYRKEVFENKDTKNMTYLQASNKLSQIKEKVEEMPISEINNIYVMSVIRDTTGKATYEKAINKSFDTFRPKSFIYTNCASIGRAIASNVKPKDIKKFQKQFPGILTDDGKFDTNYINGKDRAQLAELEDKLKNIRTIVKENKFNVSQAASLLDKLIKEKQKNAAEKSRVERLKKQKEKYKSSYDVNFANDVSFEIYSNVEMPAKLKTILDTGFKSATEISQSEVQNISNDEDQNLIVRGDKFLEANADNLSKLTQVDAEEIINFYIHSTAIQGDITRNELRNYDAYKMLVLGYFVQQNRNGVYSFTEDLLNQVKRTINVVTSSGATVTATAKTLAKLTDPNRVVVESLKHAGIEVSDEAVDALVLALNLPTHQRQPGYGFTDTELQERKSRAIEEAIATISNDVRFQRRHSTNKKSFFDQLWKIQRWAMLSSPGTALRNITSNVIVDKVGKAAEKVGQLATKALPKRKSVGEMEQKYTQYKIVGTKVSDDTKNFVEGLFENSIYTREDNKGKVTNVTFYDLMNDGMSKYFADNPLQRIFKSEDNDTRTAAQAMARSIIVKLFGEEMFNTENITNKTAKEAAKVMNKVAAFTFKFLSDDPWIKKETKRLFGAMLTEDNVPINEGYSTKVLDTLANAYAMAAYEYMHRDNFATKIESLIHNRLGSAGYFAYKQLFPFLTSSVNWFNEGLNYTPYGLAKGIINYIKLEKTIHKMEVKQLQAKAEGRSELTPRFAEYLAKKQIGQGILGSIGLITGALLAGFGFAGLDEEDDKYKLRIGTNIWIDISDLVGSSGMLAGIAMVSIFKDDDTTMWDVIKGTMNTIFDDSIYNGIITDITYSNTLTDFVVNKTENAMLSFIPNALKLFNKMLYVHAPQYSKNKLVKFLQRIAVQMVPGAVYALPKKVDIYTGETEVEYNLPWLFKAANSVLPIDVSPYNVSEIEQEALYQGVNRSYLTGNYKDIGQLNSSDVIKLNKKYGELNKEALTKLYSSKTKYKVKKEDGTYTELTYNKMTTEQKKSVIQRIMSDNALYAKVYVYTSNGGKYYTTEDEYKTLKKLGIKNVYIVTNKKKGFN